MTSKLKLLVVLPAILAVAVLSAASSRSAHACSPPFVPEPARAIQEADAIFVGEIRARTVNLLLDFNRNWLDEVVLFQISDVYSGIAESQALAYITVSESCHWRPLTYRQGDTLLVYAKARPDGDWETSYFHGTQPIRDAGSYISTLGASSPPARQADLSGRVRTQLYTCGLLFLIVSVVPSLVVLRRRSRSRPT